MHTQLLYLFTRTPLHVGAGSSVGAIDQPIQRERHTGFPIVPASALKGSFADQWPTTFRNEKQELVRVTWEKHQDKIVAKEVSDTAWLFGSDEAKEGLSAAGALLFGEARLLAFPIRSARGSFAWITSPLLLRRAAREGVFTAAVAAEIEKLAEPGDGAARFATGKLDLDVIEKGQTVKKIVLEEYCFTRSAPDGDLPAGLGTAFAGLLLTDPVWKGVADRLVILSDGQLSHFATTACEVAQHVRIDDETGTAATGGLFNQENVPSETMFYFTVRATKSRLQAPAFAGKSISYQLPTPPGQAAPPPVSKEVGALTDQDALDAFTAKIADAKVFQFGGDASTGLGYCTVTVGKNQGA